MGLQVKATCYLLLDTSSITHVRVAAAIAILLGLCGCVPIPYPAAVSTQQTLERLPAPLLPEQSIVVSGSPTQCIVDRLSALSPPIRVIAPESLPQPLRLTLSYQPTPEDLATALADPAVKDAVKEQRIAYAVQVSSAEDHGCDLNVLFAAGGHHKHVLHAQILEISSSGDVGDLTVSANGEWTGFGFMISCSTKATPAGLGVVFLPAQWEGLCDKLADELHRYFTFDHNGVVR